MASATEHIENAELHARSLRPDTAGYDAAQAAQTHALIAIAKSLNTNALEIQRLERP